MALANVRRAGLRVVLTTVRELEDWLSNELSVDAFDVLVAEAGGILYRHDPPTECPLAPSVPTDLLRRLHASGIRDLSFGRVTIMAHRRDANHLTRLVGGGASWRLSPTPDDERVVLKRTDVDDESGIRAALRCLDVDPERALRVRSLEPYDAGLERAVVSAPISGWRAREIAAT